MLLSIVNSRTCACIRSRNPTRMARISRNNRCCAGEVTLDLLLDVSKRGAEAGKEIIMEALNKPRSITFKMSTADIVTETDRASEEAVLKVVKEAFPEHAFLGEEGGVSGDVESEYLWCIDPLDGTTNFAHSYPAFAVSVGVLHRSVPVVGCVIEFTGGPHAWSTRIFTAQRGGGAFCNGEPICVSSVDDVTGSLLVTGFGYDHDDAWASNMETFKELTDVSQGVRRLGAAAIDLCHVSLGIVEAYWEYRLKPWDVCAGIVVLEEAGGKVTTMDGKPHSVFAKSIMATNGALHDTLLGYTSPKTKALIASGIDLESYYTPDGYPIQVPKK